MPEICRFYGIIIYILWKDHNPPHIHFSYGDYECSMNIADGVTKGEAPAKVIAKVDEWIGLHKDELLSIWEKAQNGDELPKLEPLK